MERGVAARPHNPLYQARISCQTANICIMPVWESQFTDCSNADMTADQRGYGPHLSTLCSADIVAKLASCMGSARWRKDASVKTPVMMGACCSVSCSASSLHTIPCGTCAHSQSQPSWDAHARQAAPGVCLMHMGKHEDSSSGESC